MAASRNCCCINCSAISPGPFVPPWGCKSCLCRTATAIRICVTEVGELAYLSTTKPYRATGASGSYTFARVIDGHEITITVTYNSVAPEGYEETVLTVYEDGIQVRQFTIATTGKYCEGSGSEDGSSYVWQPVRWNNPSEFTLTLAGINLVLSPDECNQNPFFSRAIDDINGTYSADNLTDYPSDPDGDQGCGFEYEDAGITASVGGLTGHLRISVTTDALGTMPQVRGFYIMVFSRAVSGGATSLYYLGVVDFDDDESCIGQWTITNIIDEPCFDSNAAFSLGNFQTIGWDGSATLKIEQ